MAFFTSRDGVKLHYKVEGSGPPLVFHLGAGADSELWRKAGYVGPLSRSYACVLFDHRGHGESDHPAGVEANHIDRYADDVAALVEHLGYSSVAFFGWSNGFTVGLKAADVRPEMFDALILFGGIGRRATQEQIEASIAERVPLMREKGWSLILDPMQAAEKYPVPAWFLDRVYSTDVAPWIAYSESRRFWNWSIWDAAPRVTAPSLLFAGELEDPDDLVGQLAAQMPNASRVRIPEREHINAFLYSEFVVPRVLEFLAAGSPQATG